MLDIREVARDAGLGEKDYEPLGYYKAKLTVEATRAFAASTKTGKLVLVTALTPTPAGEGKTTMAVGLTQGLRRIKKSSICTLREPALGPIFGIKGGACGGGYSQVLPMEDINLFFTGDFPAITAAHNLLSALLDAHLQHGNALGLDTRADMWPRTLDMNDRALRHVVVGLGGLSNGYVREDRFVITPASEVMAILALSESLEDLKQRLGSIVVGVTTKRAPVFARDLKAHGAMAALLRTAIRPNLVQTMEGGPALIHGGPFGNIAHGCSSIQATRSALCMADYAVTEAGFCADLGAEKFLNIVCPRLGRGPDVIVLVATVRSALHHGAGNLEAGAANVLRHIRHLRRYGVGVVVAVNRRVEDAKDAIASLVRICEAEGVPAVACDPWNAGGAGCEDLARLVVKVADAPSTFHTLYHADDSAVDKLQTIVTKAYGGAEIEFSDAARRHLEWAEKYGFGQLPICVAKTQYSLTDDPKRLNAPEGFTVHVRDVRVSAGAGFLVAICGDIMLMPGLGKDPSAFRIDVDADGKITGLF